MSDEQIKAMDSLIIQLKDDATRRKELLKEIKNWIDSDSEIRKYMVPEELYNDLVCELDKEVTA